MKTWNLCGIAAAVAFFFGVLLDAECRAGVTILAEDGAKLEVSEKTYQRLSARLGVGTEIGWESCEPGAETLIGRLYRVASQFQFAYLFCADGEETVLDDADALSVFFDKNPTLMSGEGLGLMISGCQLIRWPSHVLRTGELETPFLGGSANRAALSRCIGEGPVLSRATDSKSWTLGFAVLHDDGAVDRVVVVGTFAPFRIGSIQPTQLMPAGSFSWPFLGTFRGRNPDMK